MVSVTVTALGGAGDSMPHLAAVIVVGAPPGWELQAAGSGMTWHYAICLLAGDLVVWVSAEPGQVRRTRCVGGVTGIHAQGCEDRGCPLSAWGPHSIALTGQAGEGFGAARAGGKVA